MTANLLVLLEENAFEMQNDVKDVVKSLDSIIYCLVSYSFYELNYSFFHSTDFLAKIVKSKELTKHVKLNKAVIHLIYEVSSMRNNSIFFYFNRIGGIPYFCELVREFGESASERDIGKILKTMINFIEFQRKNHKSDTLNERFKNNLQDLLSKWMTEKSGDWEKEATVLENLMNEILN